MKSTAKTVGLVMVIMVLSRLMSLVSVSIYAAFFGNTPEMNIYSYAVQFPNTIFAIFGTALSTVVIPIFAGYIGKGEHERAYRFADNVTGISMLITFALTLVGILAAPLFPLFTAYRSQGYDFAVLALRIMFPVMMFYALNYILQGVLQSLGKFGMPAFVSVPSSLAVILYVFLWGHRYGVKGLLVATFFGLSLQGLILIPPAMKAGYRLKPAFDFKDGDVKKAILLMIPVAAGTSAYQLNILFNVSMMARFGNTVMVMVLVQNLILNSILAFIYSITAVIYPKFTMLAARNDMEGFKSNLSRVLRSILYFLLPATAGFIAVGPQLLNLLIAWGKMTPEDVGFAVKVLGLYALGITGVGVKEVVDRAFYSLNDTKKPAYNGALMMLVNISLSLILMRGMGVFGIPLANSVSALTGAAVITFLLGRRIGGFGGRDILKCAVKAAAASIVMAGAVYLVNGTLKNFFFGFPAADKAIKLFIPVATGAVVYYAATCALKLEEAMEVWGKVKGRLRVGR